MLDIIPDAQFSHTVSLIPTREVSADAPIRLPNWPLLVETFQGIYITRGKKQHIGRIAERLLIVAIRSDILNSLREELAAIRGVISVSPIVTTYLDGSRLFPQIEDSARSLLGMVTFPSIFISDTSVEGLTALLVCMRKDSIAWIRMGCVINAAELSLICIIMSMTQYYWIGCVGDLWLVCTTFEKTLTKGIIRKLAMGYSRPVCDHDSAAEFVVEITDACREFYSAKFVFDKTFRTIYTWPDA